MGKYVDSDQIMYVFVERTADAPPEEESIVKFEAYVEIGPQDRREELYNKNYQRDEHFTQFNIDSKCNLKKIFDDDVSQ